MPTSEERRRMAPQSNRPRPSRLDSARDGINNIFTGSSRVTDSRRSPGVVASDHSVQSPKTPRLVLGLDNFCSTRLAIPYLNRTAPSSPVATSPTSDRPTTPISSRPITANALRHQLQRLHTVSSVPSHIRHHSTRTSVGVDPAEIHLAELAESGRRMRKHKRQPRTGERVLWCGPPVKNSQIRRKIVSCIVSGLLVTIILTTYLALALTNRNEGQEFHVLLILVILVTTIFFCHSLIRLCMMLVHPQSDDPDPERQDLPEMSGIGGYANPRVPIQVALARDEEAAGIENAATKFPPPAYGLWRESVRVDPDRIFWQRNAAALQRHDSRSGRPATANRPPSYISEDGVEYVVEATARSIAPTTDVSLPPHPSERGRIRLAN